MTLFKRQVLSLTALICLLISITTTYLLSVSYSTLKNQHITSAQTDIERALAIMPKQLTSLVQQQILTKQQEQELSALSHELFPSTIYSQVNLITSDSRLLFEINQRVLLENIPQWFQSVFNIPSHTEKRIINNDKETLGILSVTIHPIISYQQLWQINTKIVLTSFLFLILSCGLLYLISRKNFTALTRLTKRIKTIDDLNQAPLAIPNETDLALITRAFNKLCHQLDTNFKHQADEAMKLRTQAYLDNISGLGNRSFFIHQLSSWLNESHKGGVALIQTEIINRCYQQTGFQAGDELIKTMATRLNEAITFNDATLARLSKDEFVILFPNITIEKLQSYGKLLSALFSDLLPKNETITDNVAIGLVFNEKPSAPSQILTQLDNALTQAKITPHETTFLIKDLNNKMRLGKQQWKSLLEEAIKEDLFTYKFQPAILANNEVYHYEVFTAIKKNELYYSASLFLGAIEDLKIGSWFDRHIIINIINKLNADRTLGPFAINITNSCIQDPSFVRWLDHVLQKNALLSSRLFFEIQEISCTRNTDATGILCSVIRHWGFGIGIDNYGRNFQSLTYLKELQPNYVKIDYLYTHQLNDHTKSTVLSSICRTAHSLNIKVIATRVETETQLERLSELFVAGYQGFITDKQKQPA